MDRMFQIAYRWLEDATSKLLDLLVFLLLSVYYLTETFILTVTPSFLRHRKNLQGKIVLITGGAGGVGQELAVRLAHHHARVIIWDNDEKALQKVGEKIEQMGHKVHVYQVDISEKQQVYKYAEMVKTEIGQVDILINNAGVVCGRTFLEIPDYMIEKTFKVNIMSHYWTTKAFLPNMMKTRQGHIVTMASLTGILGSYKCTDYSATKHATMGFHESLWSELKTHGYHDIKMTLICPYFINTGMFSGCKPRNFDMLEPKDVAKRIILAIQREEFYVTLPGWARFVLPLKNFTPAKMTWEMIHRLFKGPQSMVSMRHFKEVEAA